MSAGSAIRTGVVVVAAAALLAPPRCFAGVDPDGAGLFALPAQRIARAAEPLAQRGSPGGSGGLAARVARTLSRAVTRALRSGISPMFLGVHGLGVIVSGEM